MTTLEEPPVGLVDRCRRLVLDQHQALLTVIANLCDEFDVDRQIVQHHVYSAHARLVVHGATPRFLALLAERSARVTLREITRVGTRRTDGR